jgi:hypothetical protein
MMQNFCQEYFLLEETYFVVQAADHLAYITLRYSKHLLKDLYP